MQRVIFVLFILIYMAGTASAAISVPNTVLFTNASTVGAGESTWVRDNGVIDWTCDFAITGVPTAVTLRVEGNTGDIDGTVADESLTFDPTGMTEHILTFTNDSSIIKAGKTTFGIANSAIKYIRGYIVTLTGGSSPTISGQCGGMQP